MAAYRYAELHEPLSTKYSPRRIPRCFFRFLFCLSLPYEINVCNYTDYDEYNQFTSTVGLFSLKKFIAGPHGAPHSWRWLGYSYLESSM